MNINILRYFFFGIAGGQDVNHTFVKFIIYLFTMNAFNLEFFHMFYTLIAK